MTLGSRPRWLNSSCIIQIFSAILLSAACTIVLIELVSCSLCLSVSFVHSLAFANVFEMLSIMPRAFSTDSTSDSLATEVGSIVLRNQTTLAISQIAVCGCARRVRAVFAWLVCVE